MIDRPATARAREVHRLHIANRLRQPKRRLVGSRNRNDELTAVVELKRAKVRGLHGRAVAGNALLDVNADLRTGCLAMAISCEPPGKAFDQASSE